MEISAFPSPGVFWEEAGGLTDDYSLPGGVGCREWGRGANAQTRKVFAMVAFRLAKMAENNVSLKETG